MRIMVFLISLLMILFTGFCATAQVLNLQEGIALFDQKQYEKAQFISNPCLSNIRNTLTLPVSWQRAHLPPGIMEGRLRSWKRL